MAKYKRNTIWLFVSYCILALTFGCKEPFSDARYDSNDEIQIMDYLEQREDLSVFRELTNYVGQRNLLKTAGNYTVFVPTNQAFQKLFESLVVNGQVIKKVSDASAEYWLDFFRYHLLNRKINTNVFIHGPLPSPTTFNETYLIADISGSYEAIRLNNAATIVESNLNFNNGYVNVIDAVLPPPTESLYDMLVKSGKYNTMLSIFEETELIDYLKDSTVTVLIESDEALLNSGFDKNSIEDLKDWAEYHIIPDSGYYLNLLTAQRFYPLYDKEALSFSVDAYGQYEVNAQFMFNHTPEFGIDKVGANGIYHTLGEMLVITPAVPSRVRLNLYPPGSPYGAQNVFTNAPARIVMNNGTQSYHQNKELRIVQFDAQQAGDYFWLTVPDVPAGKYRIR